MTFSTGEVWGDGAGAAQALTAALAPGAGDPLKIDSETELICIATVGVADCAEIEFRVDWHPDPDPMFNRWPIPVATAQPDGVEVQRPRLVRVPGTIGVHTVVLRVPVVGNIVVQARAIGLGAGATLLVTGFARHVVGDGIAAPGGSGSDAIGSLTDPALCWTAVGGALAGVLAAVPCAESLNAANRWHAIPAGTRFVRFTAILSGAGAPTGVVLQPMYSPDAGVTAKPLPLVKTVVNRVFNGDLIHEVQGLDGATTRADGWLPPILVPRDEIPANATHVQLRAAKNGGGAGTALLSYVAFEG